MPYSVGLQSAATAFLSSGFATQFVVAVIAFLFIISVTSASQEGVDAPKSLPGYSLFHITPFFRKRYDFLNWGFHATGQNIFQLNLLRVRLHYFILGNSYQLIFLYRIPLLSCPERVHDRFSLQPRVWT
jgi:hypothetical protein